MLFSANAGDGLLDLTRAQGDFTAERGVMRSHLVIFINLGQPGAQSHKIHFSQADEMCRVLSTRGRGEQIRPAPDFPEKDGSRSGTWRLCSIGPSSLPFMGCYLRPYQSLHLKYLLHACSFQTILRASSAS